MKRYIVIIAALLLAATTLLSFKLKTKEVKPTEKYETMWKQFEEHLKNSLPESAEKVLNEIEGKALKDHNDIQLLKTILYRLKVMNQTIEDEPEQAYLAYANSKLETLDEVSRAVLHCQIASGGLVARDGDDVLVVGAGVVVFGSLHLEVVATAHAFVAHVVEGHEFTGGHAILVGDACEGLAACHLVVDGAHIGEGSPSREILIGGRNPATRLNHFAVGVQVVTVVVDAVLAHDKAIDLL